MFGGQTKPQKPVGKKSGSSSQNGQNMSIEGTLKRVLDAADKEAAADTSSFESAPEVDAPLVQLVNALLIEAIRLGASDIHIEPFETFLRVRLRIDGVLQEVQKVPHKLAPAINSRLKIMADLDICEKRIPQDGCIKFRSGTHEADFRMNTLPSQFGEKIVMRVMSSASVNNDLTKLGIPDKQLRLIRDAINRPDGLVLVTGPTGSGKTTTLYAALNELNDISVSVFTAEDPIEGTLLGVTQCGVNATVGYTFAQILRSLLRQDPDVILVGEIRDQETAEISIKAALTGHLVLSTLHTNCAVSTISRLLNMGIAPYLITSSLNCVVAQRLVRRICVDCAHTRPAPVDIIERLGPSGAELAGVPLTYGKGCKTCNGSGYKGRAPIYEVLSLSDHLRQLILHGSSREEMKIAARREGMMTLRDAGLDLVKRGITTLEEVLGATNEEAPLPELVQPAVVEQAAAGAPAPEQRMPASTIQARVASTQPPPQQVTEIVVAHTEIPVASTSVTTQVTTTQPLVAKAPGARPIGAVPSLSVDPETAAEQPTTEELPPSLSHRELQPRELAKPPTSTPPVSDTAPDIVMESAQEPTAEELSSRWKRSKGSTRPTQS